MLNRRFCLTFFFICLTSSAFAAAEWETDYGKAVARAKAENKSVLLDFNGSDWCGPCIEMRKRVFSSREFTAYAAKNLILVDIDFPQRKKQADELKKQNEKLGKQYGIDEKGFPTIVLLDPNGKVLREFTGYEGEGSSDMIAWIEGKKKM